jgi:pyruvate,water dikinase
MKYLISPQEYILPNSRIDGFRKLKEVNARTVEISVFSLEAFEYFLENKKLPPEFVEEIEEKSKEIIAVSLTHAAVVRRAYIVPGLDNPPGPYFLGLSTPPEVTSAVKKLFEFAISQGYHLKENSQVSGFIYPFIDPEKYNKERPDVLNIPYGGYAVTENGNVEIYAVFGNNEGVQSLVTDRYVVGSRGRGRLLILKKEIPQKNQMICTTADHERDVINVPLEVQFDQVLVDNEILEVARVLFELSEKYGPQRVEFTADKKGLIFNEVADYWKENKEELSGNVNVKGVVREINNLSDFKKLSGFSKDDLTTGKVIVKVGENIISNRDYDVLGALAAWRDGLFVLYPGVAATQHAMRVLTDKGHKAFLIGNQRFNECDEAQIVVTGGKVRVTNISRTENQNYVSLWDASLLGTELCGGKAGRLSKLKILGFQVPHGCVITTQVFEEIVRGLNYKTPVPLEAFSEIFLKLETPSRNVISTIDLLTTDYQRSGRSFSVRSSATIEDDSKDSMAGKFETFLNVSGDDISKKAIKVIQSAFSDQIKQHILATSPVLAQKMKMAVILQEMVKARCAGVIFGVKVQTGNLDIVEIEATPGLGEGIVSGKALEVEHYLFSRSELRVVERKGPELLSQSEAKALFSLSERLRSEFNDVPQDIEWAIDQNNQIWVLQSRDLYLGGGT